MSFFTVHHQLPALKWSQSTQLDRLEELHTPELVTDSVHDRDDPDVIVTELFAEDPCIEGIIAIIMPLPTLMMQIETYC